MIDGAKLRAIRTQKGLTQLRLGLLAGCRPETISVAEREVLVVSEDMARKIADALGVPVSHISHAVPDATRADGDGAVEVAAAEGPVL